MTLKLTNIFKSFKSDRVLQDISFSVAKGETLVLFGPSGAGKTVLLRLIAGVIDPDQGSIEINGEDMANVEPEYRGIGMAFQNFALFPHMDAQANIASPLTAQRQTREKIKETVLQVARLLKIDHVLHHKPKELSNGQKQRTALARALAGAPSLLLLDDPLRNVDAKLRFEMRLELPRLLSDQKATVIYVTQDYKEAMALGTRIAVMNNHGIAQLGKPEDIYFTPENIDIARLFGDPVINLLDVTPQVDDGKSVQITLSDKVIKIDSAYASAAGQPCVLGVRPEVLGFCDANDPVAIPVTIEAETPLNEKTVTLVRTMRGREIMLSRPSGTSAPNSGAAHIKIDARHVLLFDRMSGRRIAPSAASASQGEMA